MNAGPSRGGAVLPEKRVTARSKLPQKNCTGLHFPRKEHRDSENTRCTCRRICQKRRAYTASYDRCTVSLSNRIGEGISTGIGQIFTGIARLRSVPTMSPYISATERG